MTAASLGRLIKTPGLKVTIQKFDPYINVDPGTRSPYQHGEVFVTEDGAETDLDLGHYERFIDINLNKYSNITTGKVYSSVIKKERDRKSTRLNSSHVAISYAVFCLQAKKLSIRTDRVERHRTNSNANAA